MKRRKVSTRKRLHEQTRLAATRLDLDLGLTLSSLWLLRIQFVAFLLRVCESVKQTAGQYVLSRLLLILGLVGPPTTLRGVPSPLRFVKARDAYRRLVTTARSLTSYGLVTTLFGKGVPRYKTRSLTRPSFACARLSAYCRLASSRPRLLVIGKLTPLWWS